MKLDKIKVLRIFLFILIVIWAFLVFNLSSQNGNNSSGLSRKVVEFFTKDEAIIQKVEPYIRKLAHFSEYGLGGVLFISLFSTYEWTDRRKITISVLLGIWYAITDEVHQLMVPGRNGAIFDVYLDSLGFSTGVCMMLILIKIAEIIKNKKVKNKV